MADKIKILIVDDHQLIIQGLLCSLEEVGDFEVVTTSDCDDALHLIKASEKNAPFQVVFTDLSFDNSTKETILNSGEALIKAIRVNEIQIKVAVITGHTETNRVYSVISNLKPNAYLLKSNCEAAEIGFAIQKMLKNEYYYSHIIHQKIIRRKITQIKIDDMSLQILKELPNHPKISNLEGIIVKNNGNKIKLRSIETKLANLRIDLNAINNTDLILKAKELGLID
ncbi:MAG: two-component system capsular synthesis response regulator RcsB [Polaribacter sp.]|jgi:two-component system capsular synthesis response regulator RcsB|tara:strand:- start:62 stop:739 length:678 start_codon:yes stop_codon:yes gene_type:complete